MTITAAQVRGARAMLDMSREALAKAASVAERTIADFESGRREPIPATLAAVRAALEAAGVEFTIGEQPGLRLKAEKWWELHLTPTGWAEGNRLDDYGRLIQKPRPDRALATIREYDTSGQIIVRWRSNDAAAIAAARERFPMLPGGAATPAI